MRFLSVSRFLKKMDRENPKTAGNPEKNFARGNLFQIKNKDQKPAYVCVYCEKTWS